MADQVLQVIIRGQDGASRVFQEIGKNANLAAKSLEAAGREGDAGLKKVDQSAKTAAQSVDKIGDSSRRASVDMQALGAASAAAGAFLIKAGNDAMRQEQQIIGITRAYGDASDEMLSFAQQMDDVTMFSDDDIRAGERYFASLKNNYDLSIAQIQELMRVTADLASASGVSFEDASSRVTAAIRGEGEAAEYLGLTMNQQSIDRQNLTLTMTNQEAAQFRLNALMQQSAAYQGTAADMAATSAGKYADLRDRVEDFGQGLSGTIGPLTSLTAGMALTGTGIASMVGSLGKVGTSLRTSQLAVSALTTAFNPLTLGIAGVIAVGALAVNSFMEGQKAAEEYNAALATLDTTIENLKRQGDNALADQVADVKTNVEALDAALVQGFPGNFTAYLTQYEQAVGHTVDRMSEEYTQVLDDYNALLADLEDGGYRAAEVMDKVTEAMNDPNIDQTAYLEWVNSLLDGAKATKTVADDIAALDTIADRPLSDFAKSADDATVSMQQLHTSVQDFMSTVKDLPTMLDDLRIDGQGELARDLQILHANYIDAFTLSPEEQARAMGLTPETDGWSEALLTLRTEADLTEAELAELEPAWNRIINAVNSGDIDGDRLMADLVAILSDPNMDAQQKADAIEALSVNLSQYTGLSDKAAAASERFDASLRGNIPSLQARQAELQAFTEQLDATANSLGMWSLALPVNDIGAFANGMTLATDALSRANNVIIGQTKGWADQAQGLEDWATDLINVAGTYGKIDDLLATGAITLEQYNAAQLAYNNIVADNAAIQEDVLAIQAMQAPIMADLLDKQGQYIESVRAMNDGTEEGAQRQLAALGMMDAGIQSQLGGILELSAGYDNMTAQQQAMFDNMIIGAAAADPVLASILELYGLISVGADGTITVNTEGVEGAQSDMDRLTLSINTLSDLLDNGELDGSIYLKVKGLQEVEDAKDTLAGMDGADVQAAFTITGDGTQGAQTIFDLLNQMSGAVFTTLLNLDTSSAVSEIENVYEGMGEPVTISVDADTSEAKSAIDDVAPGMGEPIEIPISFVSVGSWAASALDQAWDQATSSVPASQSSTVTIDADNSAALAAIDEVEAELTALGAWEPSVSITADNSQASGVIQASAGWDGLEIARALVFVDGDNTNAAGVIQASSGWNGVDLAHAKVYVDGDNTNASGVIQASAGWNGADLAHAMVYVDGDNSAAAGVIQASAGWDGQTIATAYVDIVARDLTGGVGAKRALHGGVIEEYASGGVIFRAGEVGPEIAHFASGGTALLPYDGLYQAPSGTYISPNNGRDLSYGGVTVDFSGATFVGTDRAQMNAWAEQEFIPRIQKAVRQNRMTVREAR